MLNADIPISSSTEDLLGRKNFAEQLARAISSIDVSNNSFVVGIYGEWGSGKSSIKNMIVEYLDNNHKNEIASLEFNPWQYSGSNITELLFREIAITIGNNTNSPNEKKEVAAQFKTYTTVLKIGSATARVAQHGLGLFGIEDLGFLKILADNMKSSEEYIKNISEYLSASSESSTKTLSDLKKNLENLLKKLKKLLSYLLMILTD